MEKGGVFSLANNFQISFVIGAALAGSFMGAFGKANTTMGDMQKKLSALSKNQDQIAAFQRMQGTAAQTAEKLNAARGRVRELGEQMRVTATPSAQLQKQFTEAHVQAAKLQGKLADQRKELGQLRTSLSAAGVDTKNFSNEQVRLAETTKLAAQAEKLKQAQERLQQSKGALEASKQRLSWDNMKGEVMASAGIALALGAPIKQAASFEQAMARVNAVSFAGGKKTPEQITANKEALAQLTAQARQLGRDTQYTATQAANSQELLARAGFKPEEILKTMPALLSMAAAEDMDLASAADIASSTLRGYQLAADQSGRVADVLAKTSAASNTSIAGIGESMKMVAPIAAGLKIPFEETAAMIGVMGDAGIKGSEAGTALRASLLRLSKEPKQTEEALRRLGVATRDAKGNLRTMPSLMKALSEKMKNMGEADKMGELAKIFGTEASAGMLAIMNAAASGRLNELTGEIYAAEGAAVDMAATMNATAQGAMKRLGSASESLMIDIGNVLLPTFTGGVETLARFTGGVSALAQEFPMVTKVLVGGVAALGAYKVAFTAGSIVWTAAKLPFQHLRVAVDTVRASMLLNGQTSMWLAVKTKALAIAQGIWNKAMSLGRGLLDAGKLAIYYAKQLAITVATKAWAAAQWLWNAAMSANPIGFIVIGIAALVAAGYWLYRNWDSVCAAVSAAWGRVWDKIKVFWSWLTGIFSWNGITKGFDAACNLISAGWEATKGLFSAGAAYAWDWLSSGWEGASNLVSSGWQALKDSFSWAGTGIWDGLVGAADTAWASIKEGWNGVSSLIDSGLSKAGNLLSGAWSWMKDLVGMGDDPAAMNQAAMVAQLNDITMLNKMSEGFADRVQEMAIVWQPFKRSLGEGFETVWTLMQKVGSEINGVVIPAVLALALALGDVASGVQAVAQAGGIEISIPKVAAAAQPQRQLSASGYPTLTAFPHAAGGIFDTPHIGLVAEAGREALIPLEDRSRGIPLLLAAGEEMGVRFGSSTSKTTSNSSSPIININVYGGGEDIGRQVAEEVRRALRDLQEYDDRTDLA